MTASKATLASSSQDDIHITSFEAAHLEGALRLSIEAGWPHRAEDWELNLSVSKGVVALKDGEIVGTALCTIFGEVATMNMIIVDERLRGRGLGRALMDEIIALGGTRELRLVATADGLPLYEKMGFVATGKVLQQQGIAQDVTPDLPVEMGAVPDMSALAAMDLHASGLSRAGLLETIAEQGSLLRCGDGFALLREFGRGRVVGPIVASNADEAKALLAQAAHLCAGQFLRVDLLADSDLRETATQLGLLSAGGGIVMKRAARVQDPSAFKTFALASQALS